jgi:CRP-like cAMP-binding protein
VVGQLKFFGQHEIADAVFYIQQGKVKLTFVSEQGKEAVVAILGPGHFFGEGCLIQSPIDHNRWAHWRNPMDMIRQGD